MYKLTPQNHFSGAAWNQDTRYLFFKFIDRMILHQTRRKTKLLCSSKFYVNASKWQSLQMFGGFFVVGGFCCWVVVVFFFFLGGGGVTLYSTVALRVRQLEKKESSPCWVPLGREYSVDTVTLAVRKPSKSVLGIAALAYFVQLTVHQTSDPSHITWSFSQSFKADRD